MSFNPEKAFLVVDSIYRLIEDSAHDNFKKTGIFSISAIISQAQSITDIFSIILS